MLDTNHDYNYHGRDGGDLVSAVVEVAPARRDADAGAGQGAARARCDGISPRARSVRRTERHMAEAKAHLKRDRLRQPRAQRVLGPSDPHERLGAVAAGLRGLGHRRVIRWSITRTVSPAASTSEAANGLVVYGEMAEKSLPPMIWVLLDESSATGTHEFADSVNNGPWGQALTTELIPQLESQYRMDGKANGRFLNGHSSGGWATLWLQTRYPKVFGGTWSTSPDPERLPRLHRPGPVRAACQRLPPRRTARPYPLVRDKGKVIATFEQFAKMERVLGPYGGQLASFEWVFSPRGADGRPEPMFDRDTGAVDPAVVAYWRDHYDIAHRLQANWPALKPDLDGKIHLYVGTADTFYLDGAAHRLKAVLDGLGAKLRVPLHSRSHPLQPVRDRQGPAGPDEADRLGDVCQGAAGCAVEGAARDAVSHTRRVPIGARC